MALSLVPNSLIAPEDFAALFVARGMQPFPQQYAIVAADNGKPVAAAGLRNSIVFVLVTHPAAPLRLRHEAVERIIDALILLGAVNGRPTMALVNANFRGAYRMLKRKGAEMIDAVPMVLPMGSEKSPRAIRTPPGDPGSPASLPDKPIRPRRAKKVSKKREPVAASEIPARQRKSQLI